MIIEVSKKIAFLTNWNAKDIYSYLRSRGLLVNVFPTTHSRENGYDYIRDIGGTSMDKGLKDALYVILILACIIVVGITVSRVTGDDISGCDAFGKWYAGQMADCYSPVIYHQQQILIQEQNQTNHLLAVSICMSDKFPYDNVDESIWSNKTKFFSKCFPELWNDTK